MSNRIRFTPEAHQALDRAGLTRRRFLTSSGALIVGFAAWPAPGVSAQGPFDTQIQQIDPRQLDAWIAIAADGSVTAYTGKCELGQGMSTVQTQLVAEELSVPLTRVRLVQCDTSITPDQGTTSGSQSTPVNFNARSLAQACATAREALMGMAAARLAVPVDQLAVADGVASTRDGGRRVSYGELLGGRRFTLPLSTTARRKPAAAWTVLGTSVPRLEMAQLVTGRFEFVHDVRVPGMLHGCVVRPPEVGATLIDIDERSIRDIPGVVKVVVRKNFVGVVTEKPWHARRAAEQLAVRWTAGSGLPAQSSFYDHLRQQKPTQDAYVVNSGDVDATMGFATATVLRSTYLHPYQMHGLLGTSCAVADVRDGRATIWSPTQSAYPLRSGTAMLLGLRAEDVRVIYVQGSGCYGINGADTVSFDAALMSQAVGRPVRVQLTRKDEMAWENYGFAYVIDQRVALDRNGTIVAWDHEAWFPALGGRPGTNRPGNVVTGFLAGLEPTTVAARSASMPTAFNNGGNAAPSYVAGAAGGRAGGTGTIGSERVLTHTVLSPFFTGPLRLPSRLQNTFAHESFMDEAAAHAKADPVEYRLRHLRDPRLIEVVKAAATASGWEARPSPAAAPVRPGPARGRGIACVLYEGDNGYCAMVAEVEVDRASGRIGVKRLVIAHDCGPISNPDGVRNQVEGGALQGVSRALGEEVSWDNRKVTSVDWRTYRSLSLGFETPTIECVLINRPDAEAMGAGETSITLAAAAIGNAVFDATGVRLREVPFTPERVKQGLSRTRN